MLLPIVVAQLATCPLALAAVQPVGASSAAPMAPNQVAGTGVDTNGGLVVLRSSDSGHTWTHGPPVPRTVSGPEGSLFGPWLLGSGQTLLGGFNGLLQRSADNGQTWTSSGIRADALDEPQLVPDPSRPGSAWFCPRTDSDSGVHTVDGGITWKPQHFGCRFLAVQPSAAHTLLRSDVQSPNYGPIYRSTDDGQHWKRIAVPFVASERPVFDPSRPNVVVVTASDSSDRRHDFLWRSTDAGLHWRPVLAELPTERCGGGRCRTFEANGYALLVYGSGRFVLGPLTRVRYAGTTKGAKYLISTGHGKRWRYVAAPRLTGSGSDLQLPATRFAISTADGLITRGPRERGTLWRLKPGSNSWKKETMVVTP